MKRIISISLAVLTILVSVLGYNMTGVSAYASVEIAVDERVSVDGREAQTVRGIDISYDHNTYMSVRDVANLLSGTGKNIDVSIRDGEVYITKGADYAPVGEEALNQPWNEGDKALLARHTLKNDIVNVNDKETRYFAMVVKYADGRTDAYMMLMDLCMILDMDLSVDTNGVNQITTTDEINVNPARLEREGYFEGVNSVLVGDATTGDIFYEFRGSNDYPIASTTKLVTYAVLMDAVRAGEISLDDTVRISSNAAKLSNNDDKVISLSEGQTTTLREILYAMLLCSSNECALAAAEHLCGTESEFVGRMEDLMFSIGATTASFNNCNGLPVYSDTQVPSKMNNRMSAEDMFKLSAYILKNYPEVSEIATTRKYTLQSLTHQQIKNTNALLYNMDNVTGLKTGTTNKAGCCLVTSLKASKDSVDHDLVVVLFGAESTQDRFRVSELLGIYAEDVLRGRADTFAGDVTEPEKDTHPKTAEGIVEMVVNSVR